MPKPQNRLPDPDKEKHRIKIVTTISDESSEVHPFKVDIANVSDRMHDCLEDETLNTFQRTRLENCIVLSEQLDEELRSLDLFLDVYSCYVSVYDHRPSRMNLHSLIEDIDPSGTLLSSSLVTDFDSLDDLISIKTIESPFVYKMVPALDFIPCTSFEAPEVWRNHFLSSKVDWYKKITGLLPSKNNLSLVTIIILTPMFLQFASLAKATSFGPIIISLATVMALTCISEFITTIRLASEKEWCPRWLRYLGDLIQSFNRKTA